jgi:hypothetical protein
LQFLSAPGEFALSWGNLFRSINDNSQQRRFDCYVGDLYSACAETWRTSALSGVGLKELIKPIKHLAGILCFGPASIWIFY